MAANKKNDPKNSNPNASARSPIASMNFWSRLQQAQGSLALPYVKQVELPAQSVQFLVDLPPVPKDDSVIYSIRISLDGSHPEIWRRVHSRSITLESLHKVLQIVMGWQDAHLHGFEIEATRVPAREDGAPIDEGSVEISQLYSANLKQFTYTYDYGDNWTHSIVIEDSTSGDVDGVYPQCLSGDGASPHEDTGGIECWNELKAGLDGSRKLRANVAELLKIRIGHIRISRNFEIEAINQQLKSQFHGSQSGSIGTLHER